MLTLPHYGVYIAKLRFANNSVKVTPVRVKKVLVKVGNLVGFL